MRHGLLSRRSQDQL